MNVKENNRLLNQNFTYWSEHFLKLIMKKSSCEASCINSNSKYYN